MPSCSGAKCLTISVPNGSGCSAAAGAYSLGQGGACCRWEGSGFALSLEDGSWTLTYGDCTWTGSGASLPVTLSGGVVVNGPAVTFDGDGGPKFKFPVAGSARSPYCCCCGEGQPCGTTCCAGSCVGLFLYVGGAITSLTANPSNGAGSVCNWSDGNGNTVFWSSQTSTWTLITPTTMYVASGDCGFPVTIGEGRIFSTCDWWPTQTPNITVTISGVPDPWNSLVNCPDKVPNGCNCPAFGACLSVYSDLQGTDAINGSFVLDFPGPVLNCGCCWSYVENLDLSRCEADYCSACAKSCGAVTAQLGIYAALAQAANGKYRLAVSFQVAAMDGTIYFGGSGSALFEAVETCSSFTVDLGQVAQTFDLKTLQTSYGDMQARVNP